MGSTPKSRGWKVLAGVSLAILLVVIAGALFVDELTPVSKLGIVILFGTAVPRILTFWVTFSASTYKRLFILRFVGIWVGVGLIALGAVLNLGGAALEQSPGRRTWVVPSGETATISTADVRSDDRFRCKGIDALVEGTPGRGHMKAREGPPSGVITAETAEDGDVTVSCDPEAVFP